MKKVVEVYKFPRMEVSELLIKAKAICKSISDKPEMFPSPIPGMPELQVAITIFEKSIQGSCTGDRLKLAICRDAKRKLANMLQQLGWYVNVVANSSKVVGAASGFDVISDPKTAPKIVYVQSPVLSGNSSGTISSATSAVRGAVMYRHCITTDPTLPIRQWDNVEKKQVRYEFMNLKPGQQYYICAGACDKDGNWVYSNTSTRYSL